MKFLSNLESKLGITRADLTATLFLAVTALAGFVYTTFFEERQPYRRHSELLELQRRYDSVQSAQQRQREQRFERSLQLTDSLHNAGVRDSIPPAVAAELRSLSEPDSVQRNRSVRKPILPPATKALPRGIININTASPGELMTLPGVGEATASAIILYRKTTLFRKIEDIMNVKGIGEKKFEKMKPFISCH